MFLQHLQQQLGQLSDVITDIVATRVSFMLDNINSSVNFSRTKCIQL